MVNVSFLKVLMITACIFPFVSRSETLEKGIDVLNQGQFKKAREIFKPLAEHGDANAAYWLAYTQFKTSSTLEAGSSLLKSAEGGNPWAMATLAGIHMPKVDRSFCGYLGWPCDEQWVDKAIEGWKKLAEEGDGKAMYALLYHDPSWWQYIPIYREYRYGELAEKLYKNKGFTFFYDNSFWSFLNEDKRIEYLEKMALHGDGIASYKLFYIFDDNKEPQEAISYIENGVEEKNYYSLYRASTGLMRLKRKYDIGSEDERTSKRAYFYCYAAHSLFEKGYDCSVSGFFDFEYDRDIEMHRYYDKITGERVTEEQLENIRDKAREYVSGYYADLQLDETTVEFFRGFYKNF
ncbi:hypothetical protein BZG72_13740 [Salinivibrio sp. PR6]|nr:hypothetical protein BZG72_13740 [Salinivibrio sp. PR6]